VEKVSWSGNSAPTLTLIKNEISRSWEEGKLQIGLMVA